MSNKRKILRQQALDFESGVPLHIQVRNIIRQEALRGELADPEGKMPTETELMERFGVSRVTIRNALQTLVEEGMLIRERGRGTFLKTNRVENWVGQLMGFTETIEAMGFKPGAKILEKGLTSQLSSRVKESLHTNEAWQLKRLRYANDKPIAIEHAFFPVEIGLKLERENLISIAMYRFFEEKLGLSLKKANQMISAVNADEDEANQLNVLENKALLYIERTSYSSENKPVEFLKAVYRPDFFQYIIQLTREVSYH